MYTSFYKFNSDPFKLNIDKKFLWLGEKHKEALATAKYGVLDCKPLCVITGVSGLGKTLLMKTLISHFPKNIIVCSLLYPPETSQAFYHKLSNLFSSVLPAENRFHFLGLLETIKIQLIKENKTLSVVVDSSERVASDILQDFKLMHDVLNGFVNITLFGLPELWSHLNKAESNGLKQLISLQYHIDSLNIDETQTYINHRLKVSGNEKTLFTKAAVTKIFSFSGGIPVRINVICSHCLLTGYVLDKKQIDEKIAVEAAKELYDGNSQDLYERKKQPEKSVAADSQPACFISYAHGTIRHNRWIARFAEKLQENGVRTYFDQWDLQPGDDLYAYMEEAIQKSDYVLLMCNPDYCEKSQKEAGGVRYEKNLVVGQMQLKNSGNTKFIPILRDGEIQNAIPPFLRTKLYLDFSSKFQFNKKFKELMHVISASR